MFLKHIAILTLVMCLTSLSLVEPNKPEKMKFAMPFSGKFFTTDNLGNLFLVNTDNSIIKIDKNGVQKAIANFKIQGSISQLDVSNPFEIYAYFRDQQTILILDNQLSQRASISLNDVSTGEITSACRSFDNGLWYFDAGNMKLFRADKSLANKLESLPMATWTSESWSPSQMHDNDKNLFMLDPNIGIAIFDIFGTYYKTIKIKGLQDVQVKKNLLYFYQGDHFQRFDFKFRHYDTLLDLPKAKMVRLDADCVFEWRSDSVFVRDYP